MIMNDVKSTAIKSIGYDPNRRILRVQFPSGKIYEYSEVSLMDFAVFMNAPSKGSHFQHYIKPYYDGEEVE